MVVESLACALMVAALPAVPGGHGAASALVREAARAGDLRAAEQAFQLGASVKVAPESGAPLRGRYLLAWWSPRRWREELVLPGYRASRLREGERTWWRVEGADAVPASVLELVRAAQSVTLGLPTWPGETVEGTRRPPGGEPELEVALAWQRVGTAAPEGAPVASRTLTFDPQGVQLVRVAESGLHLRLAGKERLGDRSVPKLILAGRRRDVATLTWTVEQLAPLGPPAPGLLEPVEGSREAGAGEEALSCLTWTPPRVIHRPPRAAAGVRGLGTVLLRVAADGTMGEPELVRVDPPTASDAILAVARRYRLRPPACDGGPAPGTLTVALRIRGRTVTAVEPSTGGARSNPPYGRP